LIVGIIQRGQRTQAIMQKLLAVPVEHNYPNKRFHPADSGYPSNKYFI
jgi:hypothetical protein